MKSASIMLAVIGAGVGLIAAWYWYQSSLVQVDPGWCEPGSGGPIEPVADSAKAAQWTVATVSAFNAASDLNKKAATWTAVSVILGAFSTLIGAFD